MTTPASAYTHSIYDVRAMPVEWSGYSANDQDLLMTGLGSDGDYASLTLRSGLRHIEPTYDTGNCLLSDIGEKYYHLGSWLEPKMALKIPPIEVSSVIDLFDDHWSHHPYTTIEAQMTDRSQSLDAGLHWQTSEAANLVADSRTGTTPHHPAHRVESQKPDTLVETVQRLLAQVQEDERASLLTDTLRCLEVDQNLRLLEDAGDTNLADRFRFLLLGDDEDEDDDVPLSIEATLGYFDFIEKVGHEGITMSVTCAHGRLCTQWKYEDGRSLVLWFKNRTDISLTALGSDRKLLKDLGRDPRATKLETGTRLLVEANFFTWRHDQSD